MNVPSRLGGFELSERLGAGAMGTVYLAVQTSLGRTVVIKTLHPHLAADEDLIARFEREARHAANLQHQNTVQVIEFGCHEDVHYIAMEYVKGVDLKEILQLRGPFPIPVALLVLRDVCRGLEAAHARDIVHRDIKPANLMITTKGVVKVMDFGLARETAESSTLTAAGSVMGSPAYMSPEQARGVPLDQSTDIFSTGLVGYEILTGVRAFTGDSYPLVLHNVLNEPIAPLLSLRAEVPLGLVEIVESMAQKSLAERCPSISDARDRLEALVKGLSLRREDDILGEFARTAVAEKERRAPRPPRITEEQRQAQTVSTAAGTRVAATAATAATGSLSPDTQTQISGGPGPQRDIPATAGDRAEETRPGGRRRLVLLGAAAGIILIAALVLWNVIPRGSETGGSLAQAQSDTLESSAAGGEIATPIDPVDGSHPTQGNVGPPADSTSGAGTDPKPEITPTDLGSTTPVAPPKPFQRRYSVSTSPGFAFIRVDGNLVNADGNIPVPVVLGEGSHSFQLNRSNGEELGTLHYTVRPDDSNRVLILKFKEGLVEARPK